MPGKGGATTTSDGPPEMTLVGVDQAAAPEPQARPSFHRGPNAEPGVYYCQVKGVTRRHGGDLSGTPGAKLFAIGDRVQLVPDPRNRIDPDALLVRRLSGEPIGFVTGRQAARFADRLDLLTATIHSWDKDEWRHDILNLRVVDATEHPAGEALLATEPVPAAPPAPLTTSQALLQTAIKLPLYKVILISMLISVVSVSLAHHAWWAAGGILGIVLLLKLVLRKPRSHPSD